MDTSENICPVCKTSNDLTAYICKQCGAALDDPLISAGYKTKTTDMQAPTSDMIRDWSSKTVVSPQVPESGIAVYIDGEAKPVHIDSEAEFVLGRKSGMTEGFLVDLGPFRGYSLGLSRRHVQIRRTRSGYEVMDLGSVNGSWLNEERLTPYKPYSLPSGSYLRLGFMRILVLYRPFEGTK